MSTASGPLTSQPLASTSTPDGPSTTSSEEPSSQELLPKSPPSASSSNTVTSIPSVSLKVDEPQALPHVVDADNPTISLDIDEPLPHVDSLPAGHTTSTRPPSGRRWEKKVSDFEHCHHCHANLVCLLEDFKSPVSYLSSEGMVHR